ncbi:hypothetical protein EDI_235850 [Entamoeba dispar SAW760]|uniref:Uncharacterized protein n=1 Tax=Entamoeba dispar (strain ATCC PRA-260 / SAW760) TaxID=370354 RepID=B0EQU0_ENTDS|nr:uncharacterized protein EDI_235850 [Entamoeba dispar SAW760]EDR23101.1 hypothetical protein EDI_235850 [Entamoeba dispar SAW760]|eukprot:EDR23101.1 hypothetical protein EDI_235850 [Entamoeba dispar SAW760]
MIRCLQPLNLNNKSQSKSSSKVSNSGRQPLSLHSSIILITTADYIRNCTLFGGKTRACVLAHLITAGITPKFLGSINVVCTDYGHQKNCGKFSVNKQMIRFTGSKIGPNPLTNEKLYNSKYAIFDTTGHSGVDNSTTITEVGGGILSPQRGSQMNTENLIDTSSSEITIPSESNRIFIGQGSSNTEFTVPEVSSSNTSSQLLQPTPGFNQNLI